MEIRINERNITLKRSFKAIIMFETATEKAFMPTNITDIVTYFYCIIKTSEKDLDLSFDAFIELLDENPKWLEEFRVWITQGNEEDAALTQSKKKTAKKAKA